MKDWLTWKRKIGLVVAAILFMGIVIATAGCGKRGAAASVNGEPILVSEVDAQVQELEREHGSGSFQGAEGEQLRKQFREQVLNALIDQKLVLQEAKRRRIAVSEAEVNNRIEEAKKTANIKSQAELEQVLKESGLTLDAFKAQVRDSMIRLKIIDLVTGDVTVTATQVADHYKKNMTTFKTPERVKARQILVADETTANKVLGELKQGKRFEDLAKKYSTDAQTKDQGGAMPWLVKEQLDPAMAGPIFALRPGQVSGAIKAADGVHVIRLDQKEIPRQKAFKEVQAEIKQQLLDQGKRQAYQRWLDGVKKKAKIQKYTA